MLDPAPDVPVYLASTHSSSRSETRRRVKVSDNINIYKVDVQLESAQDGCKTSTDVRCRDVGSEESTREEVGCGANEDVKMDEWSHQA